MLFGPYGQWEYRFDFYRDYFVIHIIPWKNSGAKSMMLLGLLNKCKIA